MFKPEISEIKLWHHFPADYQKLLQKIHSKEGRIFLVGGSVRDWILNETLPSDLDFEIRHKKNLSLTLWKNWWEDFLELLHKEFRTWKWEWIKDYLIIKGQTPFGTIELAAPREEKFDGRKGHHNFVPFFDGQLEFEKSVLRRDFTMNAMGVEFVFNNSNSENVKVNFYDPLNGLEHLELKKLFPCSDNFHQDPVRFLRAIRFSQKFQFEFSSELEAQLKKCTLDQLSFHYLFQEAKKANNMFVFFSQLGTLLENWKFPKEGLREFLGPFVVKDLPIKEILLKHDIIQSVDELLWVRGTLSCFSQGTTKPNQELKWAQHFCLSEKVYQQSYHLSLKLQELSPNNLNQTLEEFKKHDFSWALQEKKFHLLWEIWRIITSLHPIPGAKKSLNLFWPKLWPQLEVIFPFHNYLGREIFEEKLEASKRGQFKSQNLAQFRLWAHFQSLNQ